jgi:caa(3)-type oxidase subunit IV
MDIFIPSFLSDKLINMEPIKSKTSGYSLYVFTFIELSLLTLLGVWLTTIDFISGLTATLILTLAAIQALIVLFYNMHLKFTEKILAIFAGLTISLLLLLIVVTMLDYIYR